MYYYRMCACLFGKKSGCCLDFKAGGVSDLFRPLYVVEKTPLFS